MRKRKLLLFLVVFVLAFFFFLDKDSDSLKEDYYTVINHEILNDNILEEDEYTWSYFLEAQDKVDNDNKTIVKKVLNNEFNYLTNDEVLTIKSIYDKAIDIDKRDQDDIKVLDEYIDMVYNVNSIEELVKVISKIEREFNIDILTNIQIMPDYKNNSKNIIYFVPVTYAFGATSDYIINDDYMTYKAYIRRACVRLWKAYGMDTKEAREIVDRVFSFYEEIAKHSKLSNELEDISSYYQIINEDEFNNIYSNLDNYLNNISVSNRDTYSIVDKEQYKYLNDSLLIDNLNVWKEVIITKILSSYANYSSSKYVKIVNDLNEALLDVKENNNDEDKAIEILNTLFSSEFDSIYEKEFLDDEVKLDIEEMVISIKNIYKKRLESNKWLSDDAIDKALLKLEEMDVIIGSDDETVDYKLASNLEISDGGLLEDVIRVQKLVREEEIKRLDSGLKVDLVSQNIVNAYYQPLDNSIVIPTAFLELIDGKDNYYERLGTIGMIFAHEITHGFDGNGSQFDEDGNLNNWWNESDKKEFDKLKNRVSNYYDKYEVLNGKYVNGKKTVNENIADLGAVACITDIALDNKASEDDLKMMFSSFANLWASIESEEYMEMLLLQDVHSPNKIRVNAVLSSNDLFYQVYDISKWNDMWIDKSERIRVW